MLYTIAKYKRGYLWANIKFSAVNTGIGIDVKWSFSIRIIFTVFYVPYNRCNRGTSFKSRIPNLLYTTRNSDRSQTCTTFESITPNTTYTIRCTIISDILRNIRSGQTCVCWLSSISIIRILFVCNFHICCRHCDVIAQSVHLEIVGGKPYGYR